jgi:3-hydroxyanthranilate 3,4-dioxygenase
MSFSLPINFKQWIDTHRDELKPPVCNKVIWANETFIVMVVGGPNIRTDYHINSTEELFYQIEGDVTLRLMLEHGPHDVTVKEGEMFLLPPMIPHSPQREANTIGFLVEVIRKPDQKDGFRWYCQNCNHNLYDEFFHVSDITKQLPEVFKKFYGNSAAHHCSNCGVVFNV